MDAHLANNTEQVAYWLQVQKALREIAPRPGPSYMDVQRSARVLLTTRSPEQARAYVADRAAALAASGNLVGEAAMLRIAEAISPCPGNGA